MLESFIAHLELVFDPEIALPSASRPAAVMEVEMSGAALRQLIGAGFEIVAVDGISCPDYIIYWRKSTKDARDNAQDSGTRKLAQVTPEAISES